MARSSRLACCVILNVSGCEVPSAGTQCIRKSRSLNVGQQRVPSNGQTADAGDDDDERAGEGRARGLR